MTGMAVRCALILLAGLVPETLGAPEMPIAGDAANTVQGAPGKVGSGFTGATESAAGNLPRVPDAPLPAVAPPVSVPMVGSSAPHTADPTVCGILGGIIVVNWIIIALIYAAFTGLFRAWLGGQAVSGWCLAMAIISTLQLLACVCICCCATCGAAILGEAGYEMYVNKHSKHVFGSHMHELVHKHKPGGTHPITEGHIPLHEHIHNHVPLARAAGKPKEGKSTATESTPLNESQPSS